MKRICPGLLLLATAWVGWVCFGKAPSPTRTSARVASEGAPSPALPEPDRPSFPEINSGSLSAHDPPLVVAAVPSGALPRPQVMSTRQIFRIVADGDHYSLQAVREVSGDFGTRRGMAWRPGMLCCRLLDTAGRVVAEQTLGAPDEPCLVLDPNLTPGTDVHSHLTAPGPEVFQVAFPVGGDAVSLRIYRITTTARPAEASMPVGDLLASFPLPGR